MIKKILFLISLPVITLAVLCCDGGGNGGEEDKTPAPYIESILTDYEGKAVAGKPVTLTGINFSPVAADNKVVYGVGLDAVSILVDEATEERVVFTAPEVSATKLNIRVSTKGKESNQVSLEFTTLPDPVEPEEPWSDVPTLDFAKLGGTTKTIVDGVEWTTFHGTWEGQIRNINIVRTTLNGHNHLGMYFSYYDTTYPAGFPECADGEDPRDLDKKCIYMNAIVGTNGPMACCHFARINGEIRRAAVETDNYFSSNCAMTIDGDKVDIVKVADNFKAKKLTNASDGSIDPPANTLTVGCAGPLLVWEGKIQEYAEDTSAEFLKTTHPRTAFGISKDGKTIVQVAVDGRWTQSSSTERAIGMSTPLLSKMMKGLGCYKAMNFDGGGGTAMWVYGEGNARNIVNHPSDNRWNWNSTGLRATGNAVYIKSDLKK